MITEHIKDPGFHKKQHFLLHDECLMVDSNKSSLYFGTAIVPWEQFQKPKLKHKTLKCPLYLFLQIINQHKKK